MKRKTVTSPASLQFLSSSAYGCSGRYGKMIGVTPNLFPFDIVEHYEKNGVRGSFKSVRYLFNRPVRGLILEIV